MRKICLAIIVCLILLVGHSAFAQEAGTIAGRVTDKSGAVIPHANITITNNALGVSRATVTNDDGLFSAPSLQPGDYQVHVEAQGFSVLDQAATVTAGATTTLTLGLSPGTTQQTVTVNASVAPQIDYETQTVQGRHPRHRSEPSAQRSEHDPVGYSSTRHNGGGGIDWGLPRGVRSNIWGRTTGRT